MTPTTLPPRPAWRTDIEGLRGVAVLLVVLFHAGVPGFGGGYVGVDVFFALSGYLITGILVREIEKTGTVDLARFYARRARRLLPASAVVLVAVVAASFVILSPLEQAPVARTALATALYLSNISFARGATDYLGASADTNPLLHTWSLAVEEQFYLAWPLLVWLGSLGLAAFRRRTSTRGASTDGASTRAASLSRRRLVGTMAVVSVASFAMGWALMASGRDHWAFFASPPRAWEFALGGLGAIVATGGGRLAGLSFRGRPVPVPAARQAWGWLGLAAVVASGMLYSDRTVFPGVAALAPVVGTVLALRAGSAAEVSSLGRALSVRPLRELGRLSYAWYLWHWPVLVLAEAVVPHLGLAARVGLMIVALGLAEASYRLVEDPMRHHAWWGATSWRGLALLAVLTVGGAALAFGWKQGVEVALRAPEQARLVEARNDLPDLYASGCHDPFLATEPSACTDEPPGLDPDAPTVALFGDSHAAQWAPALQAGAREHGWRLVYLTKSSCPPVATPIFNEGLGRRYTECDVWKANALDTLNAFAPDVVVISGSVAYALAPTAFETGTRATLRALAAPGRTLVVVADTPTPDGDVPACLSRRAWAAGLGLGVPSPACDFPLDNDGARSAARAATDRAVASLGVRRVDVSGAMCPGGTCRAERDGRPTFRDAHHLTAAEARAVAEPLVREIIEAMPSRRRL